MNGNIKIKEYLPNGVSQQILVFIHGFGGDKESSVIKGIAEQLQKKRVRSISFDLPCHGEDETVGTLNLDKCFKYVEEIFEYAFSFNLPVSAFAASFGGFLFLNYLIKSKRVFKKVILKSPAVFMDKVLTERIIPFRTRKNIVDEVLDLGFEKRLYVDGQFLNDLKNNSLLREFEEELYIIQGKKDDIVDFEENEQFFLIYNKKQSHFFYFENTDHRFKKSGELEKIISITETLLTSDD